MRSRGFVLVSVLMLTLLLLVVGLSFLSQATSEYEGARASARAAQARAFAWAGIEQVRAKLDKDPRFPPVGAVDQIRYAYQESIVDPQTGSEAGNALVELDLRYLESPYQVLVIRSTGVVGPLEDPWARRTLEVEFDLAPRRGAAPNPKLFEIIRVADLGGI